MNLARACLDLLLMCDTAIDPMRSIDVLGAIDVFLSLSVQININATSGAVWDFASGANCNGGAATSDGILFWDTGYDLFAISGGNSAQALYGFGLP